MRRPAPATQRAAPVARAAGRTWWTLLAAPALLAVVFELVRLPAQGPMVDGVHATTYGLVALVAGRASPGRDRGRPARRQHR